MDFEQVPGGETMRSKTETARDGAMVERNNRESALVLLERWRKQGFDMVVCHPSGYCSPMNSAVWPHELGRGYKTISVDSSGALEAVANAIGRGFLNERSAA